MSIHILSTLKTESHWPPPHFIHPEEQVLSNVMFWVVILGEKSPAGEVRLSNSFQLVVNNDPNISSNAL